MTWFKVDDKLHSHKKAARAGVGAMGLWTVAGSWCADHLSDGFVPDYIAHRLAPGEADELAARLVTAGLWTPAEHDGDEGWWFNDWGDYQPTRDDVESQRERERDKKRNQRRGNGGQFEASPSESPEVSPGDSDGSPEGSPAGVTPSRPVPSRPEPEGQTLGADKPRKRSDPIFEAVAEACGVDWRNLNDVERGKVNKATKLIKQSGGTVEEIHARARRWPNVFPKAKLTVMALANNWSSLAGMEAVGGRRGGVTFDD